MLGSCFERCPCGLHHRFPETFFLLRWCLTESVVCLKEDEVYGTFDIFFFGGTNVSESDMVILYNRKTTGLCFAMSKKKRNGWPFSIPNDEQMSNKVGGLSRLSTNQKNTFPGSISDQTKWLVFGMIHGFTGWWFRFFFLNFTLDPWKNDPIWLAHIFKQVETTN